MSSNQVSFEVQYFPTPVILTVAFKKLLCGIEDVYKICNFLTGDQLYTHQLIRAHVILSPWILEQYPQLREWDEAPINTENWQEYVKLACEKFGHVLPLTPLPHDRWTHIDPVEEACAMVGDDNVLVVDPNPEAT